MTSRSKRVQIAALVIAVIVVVAVVAAFWPDKGKRTIVAQFDTAAGLYEGNKVSILGMPVGTITEIAPRGTAVDITMQIDSDVDLPADVSAVAVSTSILTDRHVELTPAYTDGPTLSDNAFLTTDRTRTPIEFDRLLTMTDTLAQELGGDDDGSGPVADMLGLTAASLDGNGPAIRDALGNLSEALRTGADPSETRDAIVGLVDNLHELTDSAARNDELIRDFGSNLHQMSDLLAEQDIGQGDTGSRLNQILVQAKELLDANRGAMKSTVGNAEVVTRALSDYERELSEFLNLAPTLLNNAYNAVDHINGTVRVHTFADRILFDQQMLKEVCNLAGLTDLGCDTGKPQDFGPDFGVTAMLAAMAGVGR